MTGSVSFDDAQLQKILAAIDGLKAGALSWQRFLALAAPVFLCAILGSTFAFFMDWLKTRRDSRKLIRERQETELAQLTRIIRSRPLTLRRHESHSTSGCADMSSRGHFAVVVAGGLDLGWRLTERAAGGAAAPRFRRSGAANVPAPV